MLERRLVINALLSLVVGGIQWRLLPRESPAWKSVYHYCRSWRDDGTWQRLHDTLRAQVRHQEGRHKHPPAVCVDSQSVKPTAIGGLRGSDAGKHVNGRQRHLLVDTLGLLLVLVVTAASVSDPAGAREVFKRLGGACKKRRLIWVDGTYRGPLVAWVAEHRRFWLCPVCRPEGRKGFTLLPRRWVVERTFGWLSWSRRLSKDYEESTSSSEAMIYVAMIRLMVRRLETT